MARRPALALALALALVVTTGGFAAAANYGLLTRSKADPVGHLNATNVVELSPTPVVPPAASEPVSTVPSEVPAEVPADQTPIDETPVEVPAGQPAAAPGGVGDDRQQAQTDPAPSVGPQVRDFSWLEPDEDGAQQGSERDSSSPRAKPAPPTTGGVTTTSTARPATTTTTERHDDDDHGDDHGDDDADHDEVEREERDD